MIPALTTFSLAPPLVSLAIAAIGTSTPCELSKVVRPLGFAVCAAGVFSVVLELPAFSVLFEFAFASGADVASAAAGEAEVASVPAELASAEAEVASAASDEAEVASALADASAEAEAALFAPLIYSNLVQPKNLD